MRCMVCNKRHMVGHKVSHSNIKTKRRRNANVQRVRVKDGQVSKAIYACTRCIRSGKVIKAA